jgi:hypothetical protein
MAVFIAYLSTFDWRNVQCSHASEFAVTILDLPALFYFFTHRWEVGPPGIQEWEPTSDTPQATVLCILLCVYPDANQGMVWRPYGRVYVPFDFEFCVHLLNFVSVVSVYDHVLHTEFLTLTSTGWKQ